MFRLITFGLLFNASCFSQTLSKQVMVTGSINRLDYFTGGSFRLLKNQWVFGTELTVGATRTFVQQRFFPRLALIGGWNFIDTKNNRLNTELKTAFSLLNLKTTSNNVHFWQEYLGGLSYSVGESVRFNLAIYAGWLNENFNDTFIQKRVNKGTIGYEASIGLSYAW
jgi:hypothetical protein